MNKHKKKPQNEYYIVIELITKNGKKTEQQIITKKARQE